MKKTIHFLTVIVFAFTLYMANGCGQDNNESREAFAKPKSKTEDSIDLSNHPVDEGPGNLQIRMCHDSVTINNVGLGRLVDSIPFKDFSILKSKAKAIGAADTGNYILALKFIFGINTNNDKINLIYQPLYLKKKAPGKYEPAGDSMFVYNHGNGKFESINDSSDIIRYRQNIRFHGRTFNAATDSSGDVKSLVFSFQEIKQEIKDNQDSVVFLFNAAEILPGQTRIKHTLLLGTEKVRITPLFYRKFGNLSHLCPPSCEEHIFDVKP